MSKNEFIKTLEELLLDIPMEERQEALRFYEGYFEDAGPDCEQSIITELGSPEKVAASIKADLTSSSQESQNRGYFTEKGYEDDIYREPKYEMLDKSIKKEANDQGSRQENSYNSSSYDNSRSKEYSRDNEYSRSNEYSGNSRNQGEEHKNTGSRMGLIILLCIFAIPVGIPLIATMFGLLVGAFFTVAGICIAFVAVSFVLTIVGICLVIAGVIKFVTIPIIGICLAGAGLIVFGLGVLFTIATSKLCTKVLPAIFRFFVDICRLPFKNRRVMA